ncbi:hypothetical protein TNCV_2269931 [Trichonephila clavipes]|nr:hypothetical protein TNCV_2269931 [Trichonephila clavipes]
MGYALSLLQWLLCTVSPYSAPDFPTALELLNISCLVWPCIVIHKIEIGSKRTTEQEHMMKDHRVTITIFGYRTIYRPSTASVFLGRPPPIFLTAVPMVRKAFQVRNNTFVDSELFIDTVSATPLLQLSGCSSTCEVIQIISSNHIYERSHLHL